jgi:hypothetical protein
MRREAATVMLVRRPKRVLCSLIKFHGENMSAGKQGGLVSPKKSLTAMP